VSKRELKLAKLSGRGELWAEDCIGFIVRAPGSPALTKQAWCGLIDDRPELVRPKPRSVRNPFTLGRMTVRATPDAVGVVIDGREVGSMHWAMDCSPQVIVWGEPAVVIPFARELAGVLGAQFEEYHW